MKKAFGTLAVVLVLAGVMGAAEIREAFPEKSPGDFDEYTLRQAQEQSFDWLMAESAPLTLQAILSIRVTPDELKDLESYRCDTCGDSNQGPSKVRVGLTKPVQARVQFDGQLPPVSRSRARYFQGGMLRGTADGGYVWTIGLESVGAVALRVHFTNFALPEGTALFLYNQTGEAFGPYTGRGPNDSGDFWTHTVTGSFAYAQLHCPQFLSRGDLRGLRFSISDIAHLGPQFLLPFLQNPQAEGDKSICSFNAECVEDASCYSSGTWSPIDDVRKAIAHMQFVSGAYIYICSGGLLADTDASTQIPYFLTANHCISRDSEASSLECYWQFKTSSCGGACYDPVGVVPRTLGADLVSHSSKTGDYCLLRLGQNPPAGSVFLGWTTADVANANGTALFRISHPQGAPQAFSKHTVNTSAGTCRSWPRGKWIYSKDVIGATEGGSSGSPVLNTSGQVVGQLSGACGTNLNDVCDSTRNATVDGAFAAYFSEVQTWLDPETGAGAAEMHVHSIVLSAAKKGKSWNATAQVTILDENGAAVSGATVTGTFSGNYTGTVSGITNTSGVASLKSGSKPANGSFTFCVDNVTLTDLTYNAAANVEDCDSY